MTQMQVGVLLLYADMHLNAVAYNIHCVNIQGEHKNPNNEKIPYR